MGIDIQVLLEYLKEEIKEVNKVLIEKFKNSMDGEFNFKYNSINEYFLDKILKEIAKYYPQFNKFLEKKEKGGYNLKDKEGLMKEILSKNNKDRDYIIKNIPAFIMSSSGLSRDVSTILTGRPSKFFLFENIKDDELNETLKNLYKNCINE